MATFKKAYLEDEEGNVVVPIVAIETDEVTDECITLPKLAPSAIDDNPTSGSEKLIKSKGAYSILQKIVDEAANSGVSSYPTFSTSTAYTTGKKVIYNNKLYKFKVNHPAGAWNASHVDPVSLLQILSEEITNLQEGIKDGSIVAGLATDLDITSASTNEYTQTSWIETTGGDMSIKNGDANLVSLQGTDNGTVLSSAYILSRGFNLITDSATISGQSVTFQVPACAWGQYGTTQQNNGILFVTSSNNIVNPTSITQNGVAVPTQTYNGVKYYIPSQAGTVTATFATGVTVSKTALCAHICWSNYRDTDFEAGWETKIQLNALTSTSLGTTMRRVTVGTEYVYDEVVFSTNSSIRKWYKRVDQKTLASQTWTMETVTESETTSYVFSTTISGMKDGGLYLISTGTITGISVEGTTLKYTSTTISSVSAFVTALGTQYIKYEMETPTSGTHSITGAVRVDDFGTISVVCGSETVVSLKMSYMVLWSDTIKNLPSDINEMSLVIAQSLNELDARLTAIENDGYKFDKIQANRYNLRAVNKEDITTYVNGERNVLYITDDAPTTIPHHILQKAVNLTSKHIWVAFNNTATTDWIQVV